MSNELMTVFCECKSFDCQETIEMAYEEYIDTLADEKEKTCQQT